MKVQLCYLVGMWPFRGAIKLLTPKLILLLLVFRSTESNLHSFLRNNDEMTLITIISLPFSLKNKNTDNRFQCVFYCLVNPSYFIHFARNCFLNGVNIEFPTLCIVFNEEAVDLKL